MSEADSVPGVGREDIEAALADPALASLRLSGAPVLVAASDPARVVFATEEAQSLFGGDVAALSRRLLHGAEPGAQRLIALSRSLLPGAAPRLERLRFFFGPAAETVTVLCRRVERPQGAPLFAIAVLGVRAPAKVAPQDEAPDRSNVMQMPAHDAPENSAVDAPSDQPADAFASRATRFAWRTDGDHVFTSLSPALGEIVGAANAGLVGRSFVDVARELGIDPAGRLVAALATRDTWNGVDVTWPVEDGALRAPVTLGAAPAFDAEEAFLGFCGFGLVHPERIARITPAAEIAEVDDTRASDQSTPAPAHETGAEQIGDTHGVAQDNVETRATGAQVVVAQPTVADAAAQPDPAAGIATSSDDGAAAEDVAQQIVSVTDAGAPVYEDSEREAPAPPAPPVDERAFVIDAPEMEDEPAEPEPAPVQFGKVVPLRPQPPALQYPDMSALSPNEKSAFEEIARTLQAEPPPSAHARDEASKATRNRRARDLIDLVARFGRSDEAPGEKPPEAPASSAQTLALVTPDAPHAPASDDALPLHAPVDSNARAILDRLPVGIVVSRFNVPIYVNRTLLEILDYPDADAFHEAGGMDRLFHGRSPDSGAAQIESRHGELTPVDARVQATDWDGQPATLVTLRRAVESGEGARAKALELELRQRDTDAREMHAILDTATDGVAVLDADGRILSLNRSGEALFGYDQNEVAGEPFATLVAPESQDIVAKYLDGLKSGGVASVMNDGREITGRARQGGSIPVFMTIGRLGTGAAPKFCAVLRDLTAWKKVENELGDARREAERASALKSDFLAKVSHEIRTPLNAILGFAEVIMDERFGPVGNDRYRDYMRDIHKSGEHVLSLVNDLLDLSKIESGKVDLDFASVAANVVVSECVSIMQPQANRERVVIRLSLAPNLPNIVADERSLRQIVLNLLSNAVKFNEPGGQVIVSTALTDAGHAVVRIKDTGVGMSDAELETALEPFRQVATSRKIEGTGLGLPLTKALVEANRASFTIKSRKDEGTLVEVVFPPTRVLAE